jgi:LPXTG-motif cell wall-anchored protein
VRTIAVSATLVVLLLAGTLTGPALARGSVAAQEGMNIGVDADPAGNTATSLGAIDWCRAVKTGDTLQVDIFASGLAELLAWEGYLEFDGQIINVIDRDVRMFQAANAGSNVFDASEALPEASGLYRMAAVDLADPPAPDSGAGVLARLTFRAVGPGLSPLNLPTIDGDNDGLLDGGPVLRDVQAKSLGDVNGDGFFDGPADGALIAVDQACPAQRPAPTPGVSPVARTATPAVTVTSHAPASPSAALPLTPSQEGSQGGPPWLLVGVGGGLAGLVLLAGGALLLRRRRRAA